MIENNPHNLSNDLTKSSQGEILSNQDSVAKKVSNCAEEAHIVKTSDEAATTLQRAWRARSSKSNIHCVKREAIPKGQMSEPRPSQWKENNTAGLMYGPIMKGPHGPKHEIPLETIDKVVTHLVASNDREGLRRLANILFTGPLKVGSYQTLVDAHPSVKELRNLLRKTDPDPTTLKETFSKAVREWRSGLDQPAYAMTERRAKKEQRAMEIDPSIDTLAEYIEIDPDQEIEITHGGGEWNILEFLRGEHEGYALERGGVGLQVSPKSPETEARSSRDYSNKAELFFDRGAVLSAKIAPKYLKAAPNGYEAGLTRASIGHLKDIKVTVLSTGMIWEKTAEGWTEKPLVPEQSQEKSEEPPTIQR